MKSEWRVREEFELLPRPVWQVYRLKNKDMANIRANREVIGNYATKEYADFKAREKNGDRSDRC